MLSVGKAEAVDDHVRAALVGPDHRRHVQHARHGLVRELCAGDRELHVVRRTDPQLHRRRGVGRRRHTLGARAVGGNIRRDNAAEVTEAAHDARAKVLASEGDCRPAASGPGVRRHGQHAARWRELERQCVLREVDTVARHPKLDLADSGHGRRAAHLRGAHAHSGGQQVAEQARHAAALDEVGAADRNDGAAGLGPHKRVRLLELHARQHREGHGGDGVLLAVVGDGDVRDSRLVRRRVAGQALSREPSGLHDICVAAVCVLEAAHEVTGVDEAGTGNRDGRATHFRPERRRRGRDARRRLVRERGA
mmetsp:Transcript_8634/g.30627  ORF Transcript_8634/g.30627 Transcript_8634/m.30627 type:complete len:308 (+) Transcript_8634:2920-3843(+)